MTTKPATVPTKPAKFWKVAAFWAPRRFVSNAGIDIPRFVADINDKIETSGFVLWDRQVIGTPLDPSEKLDIIFEPESLEYAFEAPARSDWGPSQRTFFGLDNPYQMADEPEEFSSSHVMTRIFEPYLDPGELIAGVLHGGIDRRYFYCPCHYATVVYTTRHRLVCMSCGATHIVLRTPLSITPTTLLTADDWAELFDDDGNRRDEEVDLLTIDFRDVEQAEVIWRTDQWEDAAHELIFFARSTAEEIEAATRGTEADASIFMEAGWHREEIAPPPALQISAGSVDLDLRETAAHAFRDGVSAYLKAYDRPEQLATAIPSLFRSAELLLKSRLETVDPTELADETNNPTVLARLRRQGVIFLAGEVDTIIRLRTLRNDLQHGASRFNQRAGLALCRRTVVLLDRFVDAELGIWIGDVIQGSDWMRLLAIPEIAATAERVVESRLAPFRMDTDASIQACPTCHRDTMLRPHPATGASCAYCGGLPVVDKMN